MSPRRPGTRGWIREEIARERARAEHDKEVNTPAPVEGAPTCAFDPDTHTYTIGDVRVPSVTQVLVEERLIDFSSIPDATLEAARQRGTYVHQVLHYYLEGDYDLDDCAPVFRGYVDSALAYLGELGKRPFFTIGDKPTIEYRFWHARRMFAGTMDYLGWDRDGVLSIDDWKTGLPTDVSACLQLAAYEFGVRECLLPELNPKYSGPIRRRAVKLHRDGTPGTPSTYVDPRDLSMFLTALACVHYRRNGMKHPE